MAHEIESSDGLVLVGEKAWHGLGTVVPSTMTALESLKFTGLGRKVVGLPLSVKLPDGTDFAVPDHVMNAYEDRPKHCLGIVGKGYRPVQNEELAQFCDSLAAEGDKVKIETAGSIRHGAKVWFLLRGESFAVRGKDEVSPYICVSNGHDGVSAMRCTYTTVRVVCSNTLHMVIPRGENENALSRSQAAAFVCNHTKGIMDRIEEARAALGLYVRTVDSTREVIDIMAAKDVNSDMMKSFFIECYTKEFGSIPANPKDTKETRAREKAVAAWNGMKKRFGEEESLAGATVWNLFNAWTGYVQNDLPSRIKNEANLAHSKLFGANADRADSAFRAAQKLVV